MTKKLWSIASNFVVKKWERNST